VFTLVPEYLRGDTIEAEKNYMDYGIQLGRRFRALKAWVIWRSFGREGMIAFMREHLRLAHLFGEWVGESGDFELSAPVSMGVVCFRFVTGSGSSIPDTKIDSLNSKIVEQVNESGKAYLTQTKLRGRTVMRIGLGNVLTTERHLTDAWDLIQKTALRAGGIDRNRAPAVP
jgi:aromatic-L-amino-acid decarboxylase